jgi:RNA polymerase-binding transcription factor DksA
MNDQQRQDFHSELQALRQRLQANLTHLRDDALRTAGDAGDNLSTTPTEHMADRGSDNFTRDLMVGVLQGADAELCDVNLALEKLDNGVYGVCEHCDADIPVIRLKALPFARLCLDCQTAEDNAVNGG